jgi:hypothetical protein
MKQILRALADFRNDVPVIMKNADGYGYKFADLPKILEVINPLLNKHGLGYVQTLNTREGITYLNTTIYHIESAEMIDSVVEIPRISLAKMNDYQAFGSGITYYRRYSLAVCLSLVTDIDNDANGEQIRKENNKDKKPALSVNQFNKLCSLIVNNEPAPNGNAWSIDMAIEKYDLTKEQLLTLQNL